MRPSEVGYRIPFFVVGFGIYARSALKTHPSLKAMESNLRQSPIALDPKKANEQHYEVPAEFFQRVLGKHLKYSSCLWSKETQTLDQAEAHMLNRYVERSGMTDGMNVLDLGCGWGSLSLYLAQRFPHSSITSVSNSHSQREFH